MKFSELSILCGPYNYKGNNIGEGAKDRITLIN
jgi:hypothetical protein